MVTLIQPCDPFDGRPTFLLGGFAGAGLATALLDRPDSPWYLPPAVSPEEAATANWGEKKSKDEEIKVEDMCGVVQQQQRPAKIKAWSSGRACADHTLTTMPTIAGLFDLAVQFHRSGDLQAERRSSLETIPPMPRDASNLGSIRIRAKAVRSGLVLSALSNTNQSQQRGLYSNLGSAIKI